MSSAQNFNSNLLPAVTDGHSADPLDLLVLDQFVATSDELFYQQRQTIQQKVERYFGRHFAKLNPNTRKAYTADLKQYFAFCQVQSPVFDPLTPQFEQQAAQLESYIDHLFASSKKRWTITRHFTAIGKLLRIADIRNPLKESEDTRDYLALTLNQLDDRGELVKPSAQNQALPLDDELLDHLNAYFEVETLQDKRDIALINFCFNTLLRGSEIAQIRLSDLDRKNQQCFVRKTKTDKTGQGCYRHVSSETFDIIDHWLSAAGIKDGPVFQGLSPKGTSLLPRKAGQKTVNGISYRTVNRIYKQVLARCDINSDGYTAHSCRVGAVVTMRRHKLGMGEMLLAGGWKSETMIVRYGAKTEAQHSGAANLSDIRRNKAKNTTDNNSNDDSNDDSNKGSNKETAE